ncbi:MAG TPA: transcription termination factor Rho [Euzebyales bacterium]
MDPNVLARKQLPELRSMAAELRMRGYQRLRKADLIDAIVKEANRQADPNRRSEASNGSGPADGTDAHDDGGSGGSDAEQLRLERDEDEADGDRNGGDDDDYDNESGPRRRRRSRRERRRTRGGGNDGDRRSQQSRDDDAVIPDSAEIRTGVLDVLPEGYGFLRTTGYLPGDRDAYVSQSTIRKMGLRRGDIVSGPIRQHKSSDKVPALAMVQTVNGVELGDGDRVPDRPDFKDMTPLFPDERLHLETPGGPISMRIVDLMSPVGKGQRGLIVSPPKAGKTTILKELGQAIVANNPECHLMVVLVDERPEEVTDMQRSVKGEIVASTFDRPADDHTQIAELAMERAKRLVEQGQDVVVLLDSITRLARAYNLSAPASGRIMSGGVDSTALYPPKRFFGAARNIEEGGSLTIIATALIETGSKMDEVIFEEFKGTGNMELRLDRRMEQKRIFPAIDIDASGTRREELLFDREELAIVWKLRRVLAALEGPSALELLIDKMKATRSNNQFLTQIQSSNLQT